MTATDLTDLTAAERELYQRFAEAGLIPLWTIRDELMPEVPTPKARPHVWRWDELYPLAAMAGELVPVGLRGDRCDVELDQR